jgi:ppGpp synthetase/RelA/SpoT-type nucleotidyltranferase
MTKYAVPGYSRTDINRAGRILVNPSALAAAELSSALDIINNWRAAHAYPLNAIAMNLRNRAKKRDSNAIVAQRLKRIASIEAKLRRFPTMRLLQIQDIGGCRAVLRDVAAVRQVVADYELSDSKNPTRHCRVGLDDYISNPKMDGYRGVHLIYEYHGSADRTRVYDGQKIEIQIRSRLQHAWATAVETVDTFTSQTLKAGVGRAEWKRFFALASTLFSTKEQTTPVPNTPLSVAIIDEITDIEAKLKIFATMTAWRAAVKHATQSVEQASMYLLYLDAREGHSKLEITGFSTSEIAKANEQYRRIEDSIQDEKIAQAVLVSVDDAERLAEAYPNYYADTQFFMQELVTTMGQLIEPSEPYAP